MSEPLPWDEAMLFGFGILGLEPRAFWSMTPRELDVAMRAHATSAGPPPERSWLDQAMAQHPDNFRRATGTDHAQ